MPKKTLIAKIATGIFAGALGYLFLSPSDWNNTNATLGWPLRAVIRAPYEFIGTAYVLTGPYPTVCYVADIVICALLVWFFHRCISIWQSQGFRLALSVLVLQCLTLSGLLGLALRPQKYASVRDGRINAEFVTKGWPCTYAIVGSPHEIDDDYFRDVTIFIGRHHFVVDRPKAVIIDLIILSLIIVIGGRVSARKANE